MPCAVLPPTAAGLRVHWAAKENCDDVLKHGSEFIGNSNRICGGTMFAIFVAKGNLDVSNRRVGGASTLQVVKEGFVNHGREVSVVEGPKGETECGWVVDVIRGYG